MNPDAKESLRFHVASNNKLHVFSIREYRLNVVEIYGLA